MTRRFSFAGALLGGLAGFVSVLFWGYGPAVGILLVLLTARVFASRGRRREMPWILVGAGLISSAILGAVLSRTANPTMHVAPGTQPAFLIALLVLLVGLTWAFAAASRPTRL